MVTTKAKSTTKKATSTKKKPTTRRVVSASKSTKVDYYPNRMTFAVSALAVVSLVLLGVMAMYGLR